MIFPGYELDSPVFSGIAIRNVTDGEFEYMDTNLTNQLALWKAGKELKVLSVVSSLELLGILLDYVMKTESYISFITEVVKSEFNNFTDPNFFFSLFIYNFSDFYFF